MSSAEARELAPRLRLGVSACLLGQQVRYDGGHKHDSLLTATLGRYVEWVAVCPEVEIGLGTPRESLRLVGTPARPRLVTQRSGADHTDTMTTWAAARLDALAEPGLHGYVLKKDSPSCGMERVRVYAGSGPAQRQGRGLFAAALMERFPLLPVEEEGRLNDPALRENFVERIFAYQRWQAFVDSKPRARDLVAFHTRHKLSLLAHSEPDYRKLGALVATAGTARLAAELLPRYGERFMLALGKPATPKKHANVLYHLAGFLKRQLDAADKQEVVAAIESYRSGLFPLVVPLTLLNHHFRRHPADWVTGQTYLHPYPSELMLRNHV